MCGVPGSGERWRRRPPALALLCLLAAACGQPPPPEPEAAGNQVPAPAEETPAPEPGLRPFLPDAMQRSTRAESFPHGAHGQIDCAVCHQVAEGHGSHVGVSCADCHRASGTTTVAALTPDQCQSCHHGADQPLTCEACHQSRPALSSVQELNLEVWSAPRSRSLDFDHALHEDLACALCHRALPALSPAEPCASCHADHHTAAVRCITCHVTPASDAHDVQAHLTCGGAGCHRTPEVEALAATRPVCLVCHQEQEEHEPGGDCVECHQVGPEPRAGSNQP